jgi:hypothetical protein
MVLYPVPLPGWPVEPIPLPPLPGYPTPSPGIGTGVSPGIDPGVSPGISPGVSPAIMPSGSITGPFSDLFNFPINWRYMLAILVILLTVNAVEEWNMTYAWVYVFILLLGLTIVAGNQFANFGAELRRIV